MGESASSEAAKATTSKLEAKLNRYIREGKPRHITVDKQKIYLSKAKILQCQENQKEHEGGFIPLLALLPIIGKAIAVAAGVGTAGATIASAVNKAKHNKTLEEIERQKLDEMKKAGSGVLMDTFGKPLAVAASKLEQVPSEAVKWILQTFKIKKEKEGN